MWYLVHPNASLAPNKRQIPPVNAARGETPTAVPHDPESIDDKAPPSTAPLTYTTYLVSIQAVINCLYLPPIPNPVEEFVKV